MVISSKESKLPNPSNGHKAGDGQSSKFLYVTDSNWTL